MIWLLLLGYAFLLTLVGAVILAIALAPLLIGLAVQGDPCSDWWMLGFFVSIPLMLVAFVAAEELLPG